MKRSQWSLINSAISTAIALCNGRIADIESKPPELKLNASMYYAWRDEAKQAHEALVSIIPVDDARPTQTEAPACRPM